MDDNRGPRYFVWGIDDIAYGPIELPTLVNWVMDERVLPESWIYLQDKSRWVLATEVPELTLIFKKKGAVRAPASTSLSAGSLRRIKIFSQMDDKTLESVLRYLEKIEVPPFRVVVKQGEEADSMYFVIQGELRAYVMLDGRESTLAILQAGDMFGEIALLESSPRTAYVAANTESVLLLLSDSSFRQILKEAPSLAAPFTTELARAVAGRLVRLTKQYGDSVHFSRAAHLQG
jgi:CRP-like cAMP-binding protein